MLDRIRQHNGHLILPKGSSIRKRLGDEMDVLHKPVDARYITELAKQLCIHIMGLRM